VKDPVAAAFVGALAAGALLAIGIGTAAVVFWPTLKGRVVGDVIAEVKGQALGSLGKYVS
jgi:hypothetical protein